MGKIVRMSELHSCWLREPAHFERRFAAGVAAGLGGWLSALFAAFWVCDEDAERDTINELMCAEWEAAGAEDPSGEKLWAVLESIAAYETEEGPSDTMTAFARYFGGTVAREAVGEDTSGEREHVATLIQAAHQRRWLAEAHAVRQRRVDRQKRWEGQSGHASHGRFDNRAGSARSAQALGDFSGNARTMIAGTPIVMAVIDSGKPSGS